MIVSTTPNNSMSHAINNQYKLIISGNSTGYNPETKSVCISSYRLDLKNLEP